MNLASLINPKHKLLKQAIYENVSVDVGCVKKLPPYNLIDLEGIPT